MRRWDKPLRIHLGCGKKMLPGYVNCDYAPCFGGKPDVCFDLLDTWPFEDESADEVLAVHVWEHFYDWQHPHLIAEARRVLKKGGLLALELPDLEKCCNNFMCNPGDLQNGYWGIYADPHAAGAGHEHQMHHSGWWPEKMLQFMYDNGFRAEVTLPKHKGRRYKRDMRCEAWKK